MRRQVGWVMAGIITAVGLAAGGCAGGPPAGDGVIDADWARFDTPTVPRPDSGVCRSDPASFVAWNLPLLSGPPLPCRQPHRSETYHVGDLTGAVASQVDLPELGDAAYRQAYRDCAEATTDFLGGDWHLARVAIVPVFPNGRQWRGQARWFRCEMLEVADAVEAIVERTGTLRDGLRKAKPLALTCGDDTFDQSAPDRNNIIYVGCSRPHTVELTGIYTARGGDYPGFDLALERALDACYDIGARYLGVTPAELDNRGGIRWIAWERGEAPWSIGDLSTRCFMGPHPARRFRGSIRGKRLPL